MAEEKKDGGKFGVILIRGVINVDKQVKDTLHNLRLRKKLSCVVVDNTPSNKGMLDKCKDYITWGEIDNETEKELKEKRGKKTKDKEGKEVEKKFYNLHPPRKGFERKGIKVTFKVGGALGYRGDKINALIKRML